MRTILQQHRLLWKQGAFLASCGIGIVIFAAGLVCLIAARDHLSDNFIQTVSSPDLFLDILPTTSVESVLVWGVPVLFGLIIWALLLHPERIPFSLKSMGALFFIRSFFVILTPMGIRADQAVLFPKGFLQNLAYSSNDFFFSGHVAIPFLFALLFWDVRWIRSIMLFIAGLFAVSVLLAHTHYSIDVFAVPFIVPTIYRLCVSVFRKDSAWLPAEQRRGQ
jgi:hypothetical protein